MSDDVNERTRFAFWSYDLFPFVLGAVGEFDADGNFRAFSYGKTFGRESIIAVMDVEDGKKAWGRLEAIRGKHQQKQRELMEQALAEAHAALPALKEWRKERDRKP